MEGGGGEARNPLFVCLCAFLFVCVKPGMRNRYSFNCRGALYIQLGMSCRLVLWKRLWKQCTLMHRHMVAAPEARHNK